MVTAFNKVRSLLSISTTSVAQFKWPQEIIGFLEVFSHGEDLMDKILHTNDAILAEALLDEGIVSKGCPSLFDFAKSSFVDQFSHALQIRIPKVSPIIQPQIINIIIILQLLSRHYIGLELLNNAGCPVSFA